MEHFIILSFYSYNSQYYVLVDGTVNDELTISTFDNVCAWTCMMWKTILV